MTGITPEYIAKILHLEKKNLFPDNYSPERHKITATEFYNNPYNSKKNTLDKGHSKLDDKLVNESSKIFHDDSTNNNSKIYDNKTQDKNYKKSSIAHFDQQIQHNKNIVNFTEPTQRQTIAESDPANKSRELADRAKSLSELFQAIDQFDGCHLKYGATQIVFADGNPTGEIMLIGEAPGANEDIQGIPFCGQSGKLLDNILLACGLNRQKVYISNSVFWRPPENRRPTSEEIHICRPFLEKHIALISPKLIIMVGSTAVEAMLNNKESMSNLRGKFYKYHNKYLDTPIDITPIYHPSYLLRQPSQKKMMWLDMIKIMQFYRTQHNS